MLSLAEARRIALAAQLFVPAVAAPKGAAALGKLVHRLGAVQIDSVNVLVRSHYLPVYSRCGAYPPGCSSARRTTAAVRCSNTGATKLRSCRSSSIRCFAGAWIAHATARARGNACAATRPRTSPGDGGAGADSRARRAGRKRAADCGKSKGSWWGWSQGKEILEWLFWIGDVTTARRRNFERLYDLTERVLPERVRAASVPPPEQARRELMAISARALGVATARDLRDYFRLPAEDAALRVAELVEAGHAAARHRGRLEAAGVFARGCRVPAPRGRERAAIAVRFADLGAAAHRAPVRLSLPAGNLHADPQAPARLLRAAVPAGRPAGRARRSQGQSAGWRGWKCAAAARKQVCGSIRSWSRWRRSWRSSRGGSNWRGVAVTLTARRA